MKQRFNEGSRSSNTHLEVLRLVGQLEGGVVAGVDDVIILLDGRHGLGDQVGVVGGRGHVVVTLDRLPTQRPVRQVLELGGDQDVVFTNEELTSLMIFLVSSSTWPAPELELETKVNSKVCNHGGLQLVERASGHFHI